MDTDYFSTFSLARLMAYLAARNEKSEPSNGSIIFFGNSSELPVLLSEGIETTGDDELIQKQQLFSCLNFLFFISGNILCSHF